MIGSCDLPFSIDDIGSEAVIGDSDAVRLSLG